MAATIAYEISRLNVSNSDHRCRVHLLWHFTHRVQGFRSLEMVYPINVSRDPTADLVI